ncbi:MAG: DUF4159 domain-containing protein [Phycisphaeraceae bacterium]
MTTPVADKSPTWMQRAWAPVRDWLRNPYHKATAIGGIIWLFFVLEWLWAHNVSDAFRWMIFSWGVGGAGAWLWFTREGGAMRRAVVASIAFVPLWVWCVFVSDYYAWSSLARTCATVGTATFFFIGLAWTVFGVERGSRYLRIRKSDSLSTTGGRARARVRTEVAGAEDEQQKSERSSPHPSPLPSLGSGDGAGAGTAAFSVTPSALDIGPRVWNPVDLDAWYYGRRSQKLHQSITTILTYTLLFFIMVFLFNQLGGCQEIYEMPAGGGEQKPLVQKVVIQKVIRKKFVINPLNKVVMAVPPIEEVTTITPEMTKHEYKVGQGKGDGAGYSSGTFRGKIRFIRLEYSGGDWDQDMGVGADLNMLIQYHARTQQKVHDVTESRTIAELSRFPIGKSPPMVYLTGQRSIDLSKREIEILREYLLDKHGMIFGDNGGSQQFHRAFVGMMNKLLEGTGVYFVKVPLDDPIHRIPYQLPFLPYVAPHGGKDALGWYKDGRWLAYYHPGDIGDAWADGHAGVSRDISEACYQLGVNVINYAHAEYDRWLTAREKKE